MRQKLAAPGPLQLAAAFMLVAGLPALILGYAAWQFDQLRILVIGLPLLAIGVLPLFFWFRQQYRISGIELRPEHVQITAGYQRLTVRLDEIEPGTLKKVDWKRIRELQPRLRLDGIGLPGLQLGWFRAADGQRAFVALTRSDVAIVFERNDGCRVLASPEDPASLLSEIRMP